MVLELYTALSAITIIFSINSFGINKYRRPKKITKNINNSKANIILKVQNNKETWNIVSITAYSKLASVAVVKF